MNPNCLFTHRAWCVKRQLSFRTWETGPRQPAPSSSRSASAASSMIARIARSARAASPGRTARATSSCSAIASGLGAAASGRGGCGRPAPRRRRPPAPGASRCRWLEQGAVEDRVGQQVGLEVARAAVHDHVGDGGGQDRGTAAGWRARRPGRRRRARSRGAARRARAAARCGRRWSRRQRISRGSKTFQSVARLDGDADPAARRDHAHRLQHPDRLAGDGCARRRTRWQIASRVSTCAGGEGAGDDAAAERVEDAGVQCPTAGSGHGNVTSSSSSEDRSKDQINSPASSCKDHDH